MLCKSIIAAMRPLRQRRRCWTSLKGLVEQRNAHELWYMSPASVCQRQQSGLGRGYSGWSDTVCVGRVKHCFLEGSRFWATLGALNRVVIMISGL